MIQHSNFNSTVIITYSEHVSLYYTGLSNANAEWSLSWLYVYMIDDSLRLNTAMTAKKVSSPLLTEIIIFKLFVISWIPLRCCVENLIMHI